MIELEYCIKNRKKNTWNIAKITSSCGNYHIFLFFSAAYLSRGPRTVGTVAFSRITSNILKFGTGSFTIIERNIEAIFREYFSSLRFDSGKIFMIIMFSRGPRATYCITTEIIYQSERWIENWLYHHRRPGGPTDKASAYESGDCRFESWQRRSLIFLSCFVTKPSTLKVLLKKGYTWWSLTTWSCAY